MRWLVGAFLRLHRRRRLTESGIQPLSYEEITRFGETILQLPSDLMPLFSRCMEETDNAVLFDYFADVKQRAENERRKNRPKSARSRKG